MVVRRAPHVPDAVTGGLDTVGVRVPDQPVALALLRAFGGGVAAPSANRFGHVSPTTAADVRRRPRRRRRRDPRRRAVAGWAWSRRSSTARVPSPRSCVSEACRANASRSSSVAPSRCSTRARCAHPEPSSRTTRPEPRWSSPTADAMADRIEAALARDERVGVIGVRRPAAPRSQSWASRATATSTRTISTACCATPTPEASTGVIAVVPDPTGLGAAVVDRLRRAAGARE